MNTWIAYEAFGLAVGYLVWFFFLRNLRDLLAKVSERNRAMLPRQVWLNLIPLFGLGWFVYTVVKIRDSVRAEFKARAWPLDGDLGYNMGLAAAILGILTAGLGWSGVPMSLLVVSAGQLACWIAYWVKTANLKNRLRLAEIGMNLAPGAGFSPHRYTAGPPGEEEPGEDQNELYGWDESEADGDEDEGGSTGDGMRCPGCGAGYQLGDRFCMSCGRRVP